MMGPGPVFIALFLIIFGIFYLHYSTRNKERLALIKKGADASIFFSAIFKAYTKIEEAGSIFLYQFNFIMPY